MEKKVVYIAGLGLIGASLALGIKRAHPHVTILGYNRSEASRTIALERGMVDQVTDDFAAFAPFADIIILALPIKQSKSYLETLAGLNLKDQVLVLYFYSFRLDHRRCHGRVERASEWIGISIY